MSEPRCYECGHILANIDAWCEQCFPQGNIPGTVDHASRLHSRAESELAQARARVAELEKMEARVLKTMVAYYRKHPALIAEMCDEWLDKSGALLGQVRNGAALQDQDHD